MGFLLGTRVGYVVVGGDNSIQRQAGIRLGIAVVAGANSCNGISPEWPLDGVLAASYNDSK
jgi:hypothetical protein